MCGYGTGREYNPATPLPEFKLHSHGENWYHFRKKLDSLIESFSITYCHDGTVCMTGDMGCLVWQREYFPETPEDFGFPYCDTGIEYFAEKIVRVDECQVIKEWDRKQAEQEIRSAIEDRKFEEMNFTEDIASLENVLDRISYFENGEHGYGEMINAFMELKHDIDSEEWCEYGKGFSKTFKMKFELLKSVSDQILKLAAKKRE